MKHLKLLSKNAGTPAVAQDGNSVQILSIAIIVLQALIAIQDAKVEADPQ